ASHKHNLISNPYMLKLPENALRICHLVLRYDHSSKNLIFDRKLKEGSGESIYGLEVAMSLSIDNDFIRKAGEIRKNIIDKGEQFLNTKKSRYNKNVYMDSCSVCGKKPNFLKSLETHHITEQNKADSNGYINHSHKDSAFNLITLCNDCHKNLHSNGLKIVTQETIKGNQIKIIK
ncbi:unnamed protein product, partial [marine sediment metagenome]